MFLSKQVSLGFDLNVLLSKEAMTKAKMSINLSTDLVTVIRMKQKLLFVASGQYCIPIGKHAQSSNSLRA